MKDRHTEPAEKEERTPEQTVKPANRWPNLIRDRILQLLIEAQRLPLKPGSIPAINTLLDEAHTKNLDWQELRGNSTRIADLTDQAADELEQAEFQYIWHPNHDPQLGDRRHAIFSQQRPKLAANLRTHARLLRDTQTPEGKMWTHVNSYSPRYPHQIPEIAQKFNLTEETVRRAFEEGRNAQYL